MRHFLLFLLTVAVSVGASYAVVSSKVAPVQEKKAQSVYERVTSSKVLRCGYITWPPLSEKEPNTGKMKGMYIDLTEELARSFGWTVEWVEEIAPTDMASALNSGRVDMMCAPVAPVAQRVQWMYFSRPHAYGPYRAYVRADDARFDGNLAAIDSPEVRISTIEGELTSIVAHTNYPKAKVIELTMQQGSTNLFENVVTGKADIVFNDPFSFAAYDATNPGKLRAVVGEDIGAWSSNYVIKFGEDQFKAVIDGGLEELLNRGYIKKIATDYQVLQAGIYMPADGFKKP